MYYRATLHLSMKIYSTVVCGGEGAKGRHNLFICQRPNRKRGSSGDQGERGERKKKKKKLVKYRNEKLRGIRRRRKDKGE